MVYGLSGSTSDGKTLTVARELKAARIWFNEDRNLDAAMHILDKAIDSLEIISRAESSQRDAWARLRAEVKECQDGAKEDARLETLPGYDKVHYGRILAFQIALDLIDKFAPAPATTTSEEPSP